MLVGQVGFVGAGFDIAQEVQLERVLDRQAGEEVIGIGRYAQLQDPFSNLSPAYRELLQQQVDLKKEELREQIAQVGGLMQVRALMEDDLAEIQAEVFQAEAVQAEAMPAGAVQPEGVQAYEQAQAGVGEVEMERFLAEEAPRPSLERLEKKGAKFLDRHILKTASQKKKTAFAEGYPTDIFQHVLKQAVFIYTLGKKKTKVVPDFFKEETKEKIRNLRTFFLYVFGDEKQTDIAELDFTKEEARAIKWLRRNSATEGRVAKLMDRLSYHFDRFEEEDEEIKQAKKSKLFRRVLSLCENIAHKEMQGGMLITGSAAKVKR